MLLCWKSPLNPAFLRSQGPTAFPPSSFFALSPHRICIRGQEVRDSATESDIWILCSHSQRVCTFPPNFSSAQRLRGEIWTNSVSISVDSPCKGGTKVHFCDVLKLSSPVWERVWKNSRILVRGTLLIKLNVRYLFKALLTFQYCQYWCH